MEDQEEADYLAQNNRLILKEMSILKQQLFGDEVSSLNATTRSLDVSRPETRNPRSASQGLNRTLPRRTLGSSYFFESSLGETSRSSRSSPRKTVLEAFPRQMQLEAHRTPMSSPSKNTFRSPTVMQLNLSNEIQQSSTPNSSTLTYFDTALNLKSPKRLEERSQERAEESMFETPREMAQSRPIDSIPTTRSPVRVENQERSFNRELMSPLEASFRSNRSIEHVSEPSIQFSPIKSRVLTPGPVSREQRRPVVPLFEPADHPNQHDQSTWVANHTSLSHLPLTKPFNQLSPNDAVLGSPSISSDRMSPSGRPASQGYPEMFRDLRRQMAEDDRNKERLRIGSNIPTGFFGGFGGESSRPSTSLSKRAILLPPQSKGRKKSESERQNFNSMHPRQEFVKTFSFEIEQKPSIPQDEEFPQLNIDLASLTPESLEGKTFEELQQIVNAFYESSPRLKFKQSYPFMAEGMVQKDGQTKMLKVFSSRLGRTMFTDARNSTSDDYVYFLVVGPGEYRGFWYDVHPKCLISAKFPSVERLVVRGYAILAHPHSSDSSKESRWICWNDSLGLMSIISGAARTPVKKQPVWDKQLDIISIHANFENNRFVVTKVVALTNSNEKKQQFPNEVFLIRDPVYVNTIEDDLVFDSKTLNAKIHLKRTLVGEIEIDDNTPFELVVVPTFPKSTVLQFRALHLIHMPSTFWSHDKEWIRTALVKRTESYRV